MLNYGFSNATFETPNHIFALDQIPFNTIHHWSCQIGTDEQECSQGR